MTENIIQIPIDLIKHLDNSRLRIEEADVSSLMTDIKNRGLLQPIGVLKVGEEYILRFGNRRLMACKKLGWKTISAIISDRELNEDSFMADNIAENVHRIDLTPMELSNQCNSFLTRGFTVSEIASLLNMPFSKIEQAIKTVTSAPEAFKQGISYMKLGQNQKANRKGKIPASVAGEINTFSQYLTEKEKINLYEIAKEDSLTGPEIRLIKNMMKSGLTLEESRKRKNEYHMCTAELPIKKSELKKYDTGFTELVKGFISGKIPPNKNLLHPKIKMIKMKKKKNKEQKENQSKLMTFNNHN